MFVCLCPQGNLPGQVMNPFWNVHLSLVWPTLLWPDKLKWTLSPQKQSGYPPSGLDPGFSCDAHELEHCTWHSSLLTQLTALRVPPPLVHPHAGELGGGVGQGRGDARGVVPHWPAHILSRNRILTFTGFSDYLTWSDKLISISQQGYEKSELAW